MQNNIPPFILCCTSKVPTPLFVILLGCLLPFSAVTGSENNKKPMPSVIEEELFIGSRGVHTALPNSSQRMIISTQTLKNSTEGSIADLLRNHPLNSFGSFRETTGHIAQANALLDLRGAGINRTRVLINGRPSAASPVLAGGHTTNLNMIPNTAVESIEIVPESASALYGSGAIAGAVNVNLKKGIEGLQFDSRYAQRSRDNGAEKTFAISGGASSDKTSLMAVLEYDYTAALYDLDRHFTRPQKFDANNDGRIQAEEETRGISLYGYTLFNPAYNGLPYDPANTDTWFFHPGANCKEENGFQGPIEYLDLGQFCGYAEGAVTTNRTSLKRISSWIAAEHEISEDTGLFVDLLWSQVDSFGRMAPPSSSGPTIVSDPRNQIESPTFGNIGAYQGLFRWADVGTRDTQVHDAFVDITAGIQGRLSQRLTYLGTLTLARYRSNMVGDNRLSLAGFGYNLLTDTTDYARFVNNLRTTVMQTNEQSLMRYYLGVDYEWFDLAGGTVLLHAGIEQQQENYKTDYDGQSRAGLNDQVFPEPLSSDRKAKAGTLKGFFPVTKTISVDTILRLDQYSDFDDIFSYRASGSLTPTLWAGTTLTAAYHTGFLVPNLADLNGGEIYGQIVATDYFICDSLSIPEAACPQQAFQVSVGANPELTAEQSKGYSLSWYQQFSPAWQASLRYTATTIENGIHYLSVQEQLDVDRRNRGSSVAVQRDGLVVTAISAGFQNSLNEEESETVDVSFSGQFDTRLGTFGVSTSASYYLTYNLGTEAALGESGNQIGDLGLPQWRATTQLTWAKDWAYASLAWLAIDSSGNKNADRQIESWNRVDAAIGLALGRLGEVRLEIRNVLDTDPPLLESRSANEYLYDSIGQTIGLSYSLTL